MAGNKKPSGKPKIFWRIFISLVGAALILIAIVELMLYLFGATAAAEVSVRRQGGSNNGAVPGQRYTWSVDYTYIDQNGKQHDGHTSRRGSDYSVQTDHRVYYFTFAPFVSALESDAEPGFSQLLFFAAGIFLIAVMNKRKKSPKKKEAAATKAAVLPVITDYDDSVEEYYHKDD